MPEYTCKKCGSEFDNLNDFKGHNLRCKPEETQAQQESEPEKRETRKERRERVPLGVPRRKLACRLADEDKAHQYRYVHNRPGRPTRVEDAQAAGYEFVQAQGGELKDASQASNMGSRETRVVGEDDQGRPMHGYLMRIKKEWYEEDQAKKQEIVDEREKYILRGVDSQGRPGVNGRYIPMDGGQPITRIER